MNKPLFTLQCILPHTLQSRAAIFASVCASWSQYSVLDDMSQIFWQNRSAIAELQQHEKARGQLAQTRNHLQKVSMPAMEPVERCDAQTKRFCMHVLLQTATAIETGALKAEFQMITWETERRGSRVQRVVCVCKMLLCLCVCAYFHVQVFFCLCEAVCECLPAGTERLIWKHVNFLCVCVCVCLWVCVFYCIWGSGITWAKISIEVIGPWTYENAVMIFTLCDISDSEKLNKITCVCVCVWVGAAAVCLLSCAHNKNKVCGRVSLQHRTYNVITWPSQHVMSTFNISGHMLTTCLDLIVVVCVYGFLT